MSSPHKFEFRVDGKVVHGALRVHFRVEAQEEGGRPCALLLDEKNQELEVIRPYADAPWDSSEADVLAQAELRLEQLEGLRERALTAFHTLYPPPNPKNKEGGGITLFEVLAVLGTLGVLFWLLSSAVCVRTINPERQAASAAKNSLNRAIHAQEAFFDEHHRFARSLRELHGFTKYVPDKGVVLGLSPETNAFLAEARVPRHDVLCKVDYGMDRPGQIECEVL